MNLHGALLICSVIAIFTTVSAQELTATTPTPIAPVVATTPIYVPDITHAGEPLPEGVIGWDALSKTVEATAEQDFARFTFTFTNLAKDNISILDAKGSCSCTTIDELPTTPWTIPSGGTGIIKIKVDLTGKYGTLYKTAKITTNKGYKDLALWVKIAPPVVG